jgi:hypothetical protein
LHPGDHSSSGSSTASFFPHDGSVNSSVCVRAESGRFSSTSKSGQPKMVFWRQVRDEYQFLSAAQTD